MIESKLKTLKEKAWVEFHEFSLEEDLLNLAAQFGKVIPHSNGKLIFHLKPKLKGDGITGTLSNRYGREEFPYHTDTVFWTKPARYVLLHSNLESDCSTLMLKTSDVLNFFSPEEVKKAKRSNFIIKTNGKTQYTSLFIKDLNTLLLKYDPTCMFPVDKLARETVLKLEKVVSELQPSRIRWSTNKTVIFDNWKILHGRDSVKDKDNRELKRIYII